MGDAKMKVAHRQQDDLLILELEGDFDSRSAVIAKDEIRSAIEAGCKRILISMEGVDYIDSAGLGTLVSALKAAREHDGNVWLAGLTSHVKMVIELTRLDRVFDIFDNIEEALGRLSAAVNGETSG
jgi:anti-sigma B factor antagonist